MAGYTDNEQNVILAEASKLDFDDIMAFGPHYFGCGWMKYKYYFKLCCSIISYW